MACAASSPPPATNLLTGTSTAPPKTPPTYFIIILDQDSCYGYYGTLWEGDRIYMLMKKSMNA